MNDWAMRKSAARPNRVVTSVYGEQAQGLRKRILHLVFCPSTMLSDVMSFAGAEAAECALSFDIVTVGVKALGWRRVGAERCDGTCPSSLLLFASFQCDVPAAVPSNRSFTVSPCSGGGAVKMSGVEPMWSRPGFRPVGGDWRI